MKFMVSKTEHVTYRTLHSKDGNGRPSYRKVVDWIVCWQNGETACGFSSMKQALQTAKNHGGEYCGKYDIYADAMRDMNEHGVEKFREISVQSATTELVSIGPAHPDYQA